MSKIHNMSIKIVYISFLYSLGIVLPLYYNDMYFDIMEAKAGFFNLIMPFIFVASIILSIYKIVSKKNNGKNNFFYILLVLLICNLLLSYFINDKNIYSLSGSKGWNTGILSIISIIIAIITFKDIEINNKFYIPLILCSDIIYIISIFHSFEIDILNLHNNILEVSYHKYLSTIGNINWFVGYLALTVPTYAIFFLTTNNKKYRYLFFISSLLGIITIALLGSDGIFLGFGILSFFCIPFIFKNANRIRKFSILLFIFTIGLFIARKLDYCMDGYSGLLRSYRYIIPILCFSTLLFVLSFLIKKENEKKYCFISSIIMEIIIFALSIIFIIFAINENNNEWGTGRIALWIDSLKIFVNFPTLKKLFGIGIECLYLIYNPINIKYAGIYTSAHSEWIQLLLTGGYINLLLYLLCWIMIIYHSIKALYSNDNKAAIACGLICYFGQTLVNSSTLCNISILSILIILLFQKN